MFHFIEDQEKNPDDYILTQVDSNLTEDECYDLLSKPRQTQRTIGFYLKKKKDVEKTNEAPKTASPNFCEKQTFKLTKGKHSLEEEVLRNKGFWVGKPQTSAHLTYKLKDKFKTNIPKRLNKEQGIFYRPKFLELDYHIKLANAGLLYSDEEISDSEEEIQPDSSKCVPLRKVKYKICDSCKPEKVKKKEEKKETNKEDLIQEIIKKGNNPKFKKIPTGCQCDFYGEHNLPPTNWDNPFRDRLDMLRQHELNKYMKPYKCELLNKYYKKNSPVKYMAHKSGTKKTFPIYSTSNL